MRLLHWAGMDFYVDIYIVHNSFSQLNRKAVCAISIISACSVALASPLTYGKEPLLRLASLSSTCSPNASPEVNKMVAANTQPIF